MKQNDAPNPGHAIKELRKSKGMTLAELSDRCGVAISTISKIENNKTSPTFNILARVAQGLGTDFSSLINRSAATFAPGCRAVTRAGGGRCIESVQGHFEWHGADLVGKSMEPTLIRVSLREKPKKIQGHHGEDFVIVLEGSVEFHMDFYSPLPLMAGDSVYFDASVPHIFVSVGEGDALILSITSQPRTWLSESDD